jgi:peroxiredoxin
MKNLTLLLICVFSLTVLVGFSTTPSTVKQLNFTLKDLSGRNVSLDSFKGRVVLLVFFTTWCPSCQDEIPQIEAINQKYNSREFTVLGVNRRESHNDVSMFASANKLTFTILLDENAVVTKKFQVRIIPRIFILDKSGKIVFTSQYLPMEQIEKELLKVLQ